MLKRLGSWGLKLYPYTSYWSQVRAVSECALMSTPGHLSPSTFNILHHHAEVALGLKGAEHADHKGVLGKSQDVTLHEGLLDLVPQDQVLLVDLLHGKALPGRLVTHQKHGPRKRSPFSPSQTLRG